MRRWIAALSIVFFALAPCWAHIGSPDVYFQGLAGPYHLTVTIRTPAMIPGVASVEIRSSDPGVSSISVVPLYIVGDGAKYPPPPDPLAQSKEDPQYFSGKIWLMESGSWQVRVQVNGTQGPAEIAVPVPAAARNTLPMQKSLGVLLFALMTLLFLAIVSILGAARREGTLEPGQVPQLNQKRRGRWVMAGTAAIVLGVLFLGNMWWNSEAHAKALQMIYKAPALTVSLEPGGKMVLRMGDSSWHSSRPETVMTQLIPDHGHLMHLFLIRIPQMDRFCHLHPDLMPGSPNTFTEDLPEVSAGHYQVFADIVRESGFPDTMVTEIDLPDTPGVPLTGDNSEATAPPISNAPDESKSNSPVAEQGDVDILADGSRMVWEREPTPLSANHFVWLRFRLEDSQGKPANDVEPYMGMAGHAEIVRSDRSVFAHIHPDGSVAMAALELAQKSSLASANNNGTASATKDMPTPMQMPMDKIPPEVSFPYGFPKAGEYRMFVQIKRAGRVETGVFDTRVTQ